MSSKYFLMYFGYSDPYLGHSVVECPGLALTKLVAENESCINVSYFYFKVNLNLRTEDIKHCIEK